MGLEFAVEVSKSIRKLLLIFICGFLSGISVTVASSRATTEDKIYEMQRQITTNTQTILDMKRDLDELKVWREMEVGGTDMIINAKVRVLETTVNEHEKILWILIAGVLALILKTIGEAVSQTQAMKRQQQWRDHEQQKRKNYSSYDSSQ